MISNFLDSKSKSVDDKFSSYVECQVSCKLSDCIREAWASVALRVRSVSRRSPRLGNADMSESEHGCHSQQSVGESTEACVARSQSHRH